MSDSVVGLWYYTDAMHTCHCWQNWLLAPRVLPRVIVATKQYAYKAEHFGGGCRGQPLPSWHDTYYNELQQMLLRAAAAQPGSHRAASSKQQWFLLLLLLLTAFVM
jgi:hypothetical protein